MKAEEHLRSGNLEEALAELQAEVKKNPAAPRPRVFLFQLLSLLGRWDRALTQLNVLSDMDPKTMSMVQTYRAALQCEALRVEVFAGRRSPLVFGKPHEWMAMMLEALRLGAQGAHEQAAALRSKALDAAPTTPGKAGQQPFSWIADADGRLGPMLEIIVNGKYYWVPFQRLREIRIEKPTDLRDLVWAPAYLTLANGGQTVGFIPTRYPGSEASADGAIRMARKTDWTTLPGGEYGDTYLGLGQRILATDQGELPLLEIRELALEPAAEPEDDAAPAPGADQAEGNG